MKDRRVFGLRWCIFPLFRGALSLALSFFSCSSWLVSGSTRLAQLREFGFTLFLHVFPTIKTNKNIL